jgi:hypothetical protein
VQIKNTPSHAADGAPLAVAASGFCATAVSHFCTLGVEQRDAQTRTDTPGGDVEGVNADNLQKKLSILQIMQKKY